MNIFFTGAIRGGRAKQPQYKQIVTILDGYGTVFSKHVADENMSPAGETDLTVEEIHDREMEAMKNSNVVVADITTPSLGVGYLIAQSLSHGKRVVCLFHGENTFTVSGMIKGNRDVEMYTYQSEDDLKNIFGEVFK